MNIPSLPNCFIHYSLPSLHRKRGKNPGDKDYPSSACTIPCAVGKNNRVLWAKKPNHNAKRPSAQRAFAEAI